MQTFDIHGIVMIYVLCVDAWHIKVCVSAVLCGLVQIISSDFMYVVHVA